MGKRFPKCRNLSYLANVRRKDATVAQTSIPYHPAIKIEDNSKTVIFEADFHASSEICLVGTNRALPHQVDKTALNILIAYANTATNLEIYLSFRTANDESAGLKQSIFYFMKKLAECVKTFKNVQCPFIAVKVEAEDVHGAFYQLRNLDNFYFLKTDWELWVCFAKKKGGEETYVKQYIEGELDRRIQGHFARFARTEKKKKIVLSMAWR